MHSQCSVCRNEIEQGTYHEAINYPSKQECRVKEMGTGIPIGVSKPN